MNDIKIREINSNEAVVYNRFLMIGFVEDEEHFRISPNDTKENEFPTKGIDDSFSLGAFIENLLVGVVSFERDGATREKLKHKGLLFRMYVSKENRGKGISKLLIQELIYRVRQLKNLEQINLTVVSSNANARKLYEKFGFIVFGTESNSIKWKNKYFSEDLMVLKLNP